MKTVDERILEALRDGPLSVRELEDKLRQEIFDGFAEAHGITVAWGTEDEPAGLRLTALASSERVLGLPHLMVGRGYDRLRSLERRGLVVRIQIEGHRPMLWRLHHRESGLAEGDAHQEVGRGGKASGQSAERAASPSASSDGTA